MRKINNIYKKRFHGNKNFKRRYYKLLINSADFSLFKFNLCKYNLDKAKTVLRTPFNIYYFNYKGNQI